ncbi:hypothetical protein [Bradyrhizobium sp. USDA 4504]
MIERQRHVTVIDERWLVKPPKELAWKINHNLLSPTLHARVYASGELTFLMQTHDGFSRRAIAECGDVKGLWATGLSITCSLGAD